MNYSSVIVQWQGSFKQAQAACAFCILCKNRYFQGTLALKAAPKEAMNYFGWKSSYTETRVSQDKFKVSVMWIVRTMYFMKYPLANMPSAIYSTIAS